MAKEKDELDQYREKEDLPGGGNGSGTARCYGVQARMLRGCGPKKVVGASVGFDDMLTDTEWQTLSFREASIGVPRSKSYFDQYAHHGYLSYAAAQALRWWFLAEQAGLGSIETRLVEYEFKYSYSAEAKAVHCLVDPEEREDIMPDWGTPKEKIEAKTDETTTNLTKE